MFFKYFAVTLLTLLAFAVLSLGGEWCVLKIVHAAYVDTLPSWMDFLNPAEQHGEAHYQDYFNHIYWLFLGRGLLALLLGALAVFFFSPRFAPKLKMPLIQYSFIVCAFALSLGIRAPFMFRTMADRYEYDTALNLTVMDVWEAEGLAASKASLILTYPGEANRWIHNCARNFDETGRAYFTSTPPLGVLLPYGMLKVCGLEINPSNLTWINVIYHLLATILFWRILLILLIKYLGRDAGVAALFGSLLFIFLAPNLWYFSTCMGWPRMWMYLWIPMLIPALRWLNSAPGSPESRRWFGTTLIFMAMMSYTDWYGMLCGFSLWVAMAVKMRDLRRIVLNGVIMFSALLLPLVVMWIQYSAVSDFGFETLGPRLAERSGADNLSYNASLWKNFFIHYDLYYRVLIPVGLVGGFFLLRNFKRLKRDHIQLLVLLVLPVTIHHIVLINYVLTHTYGVWPSMPWILVFSTLTFGYMIKRGGKLRSLSFILLVVAIAYNVSQYQSRRWVNFAKKEFYFEMGERIKNGTSSDEVAFIQWPEIEPMPQVVYYAQRNIKPTASRGEALAWLKRVNISKGQIFHFDADRNFIKQEAVALPE